PGTSVSSSSLLPCSRWVLGATPLGKSRLRRRSSCRHRTRVNPRYSDDPRRRVVLPASSMRTIDACSCSCCSAPSDRDKSDDCSPVAPTSEPSASTATTTSRRPVDRVDKTAGRVIVWLGPSSRPRSATPRRSRAGYPRQFSGTFEHRLARPAVAVDRSATHRPIASAPWVHPLTWEATRMLRMISLLAMLAIMASCAPTAPPPRYAKPNASLDDVRRDMFDCARTALGRGDDPVIISAYPRVDRDAVDQC